MKKYYLYTNIYTHTHTHTHRYLQPATKVGPAPEEVIEPLVLVFETPGIEEEEEERWSEEA
jgi:hypothetical protein